eukprot:CAMPEP_0177406538 /NCGR_PEP_ID=MMETSP0368-20130122/62614_1 /TAXON_ID=447022 ORGANISM="Scrippsiella hangoei-like, Strain SHHI-4" /NCGR_SAMPLE_ID=MMETSP0368 /ASSEMBLY_ACC=CAM_ASM_000363 /LENGTH=41 /DNA_ID= /DNA_START= /DNA_END= /DNA_ORIENTATION=
MLQVLTAGLAAPGGTPKIHSCAMAAEKETAATAGLAKRGAT